MGEEQRVTAANESDRAGPARRRAACLIPPMSQRRKRTERHISQMWPRSKRKSARPATARSHQGPSGTTSAAHPGSRRQSSSRAQAAGKRACRLQHIS